MTGKEGAGDGARDVTVVGAGISGLVAAWRLRRAGFTVQVVDAAARPGGVIGSVRRDGFLFERGPNSALDTTPLIGETVRALGLQPAWRFASATANRRYVVRDGHLVALPTSPLAFAATPLFSPAAKVALLREPFVARAASGVEESIAGFVRRRLGREFLDYAIDPFVAGIYAGDPERISVPAAFPKLHALEQRWGSLIRGQVLGARERRHREAAKNTARSFSFDGGLQVLTDALAAAVGPVTLGARVARLARDGATGYAVEADGGTVLARSRAVVLATPADAAAALLRTLVPPHGAAAGPLAAALADAADALDAIPYAPVATVASAYDAAAIGHPLDGFGALVPRREARRVLGVLFSSSMFDGRAPAGAVLLTTFVGGLRQPELVGLPDAELAALVHAEHVALLGARAAPRFQHVTRWPRAIPQYTLGHLQRVARVEAAERAWPGLVACANWRGGVSVGDCIRSGHEVADALAAPLRALARA